MSITKILYCLWCKEEWEAGGLEDWVQPPVPSTLHDAVEERLPGKVAGVDLSFCRRLEMHCRRSPQWKGLPASPNFATDDLVTLAPWQIMVLSEPRFQPLTGIFQPLMPLNVCTEIPWAAQSLCRPVLVRAGILSQENHRREPGALQTCWCRNSLGRDRFVHGPWNPMFLWNLTTGLLMCVCGRPPRHLELWERKDGKAQQCSPFPKPSGWQMSHHGLGPGSFLPQPWVCQPCWVRWLSFWWAPSAPSLGSLPLPKGTAGHPPS